ncbi:MAG TPA: 16S rRNA (adenine(1518)-N(6)/adenine(1519)-N(6))-dimethyltransferase RsmA [Candidatus Acidoferrales bacterium]|nr:16S rRNA (adenine(1518)-N(6)/adenine(1519)-N(6))-dimethyltransferase RsmA [Candidatus Acidoferrales bacterium]
MTSLYQEVQQALRELPVRPSKRLGQHFLIDRGVLERIVELLQLKTEEEVLEIGPGLGFLTRRLAESARRVWAVEIDPFIVEWLRRTTCPKHPNLELVHADILAVDLAALLPDHPVKLAGNLPYQISTPLLFRLTEHRERFSLLVLMLQREVADRLTARPGTKAYGALSVWWQLHGEVGERLRVAPEGFFPRPKVQSMVLQMRFFPQPRASVADLPLVRKVVRAAFNHRRKTLVNALGDLVAGKKKALEEILRDARIDPNRRGETLDVGEFVGLAQIVRARGLVAEDAQAGARARSHLLPRS